MKRKYYPNNWDAIKQCPPHYFPEMPFEEFKRLEDTWLSIAKLTLWHSQNRKQEHRQDS